MNTTEDFIAGCLASDRRGTMTDVIYSMIEAELAGASSSCACRDSKYPILVSLFSSKSRLVLTAGIAVLCNDVSKRADWEYLGLQPVALASGLAGHATMNRVIR